MKMRYVVDVEMKGGYSPMTERRVETAVWDAAPTPGSIRSVSVVAGMVKDEVMGVPLFASAVKRGGKWYMGDYFNSSFKARGEVSRAKENNPEGEYAVMRYNEMTSTWEVC